MRAKSALGVSLVFLGILVIATGLYNFNQFFFVKGWSTWDRVLATLPIYATFVSLPIMIGILLVIDGSIVYRLRRWWTLQMHFASNLIWLYSTKILYDLLSEPATDAQRYQQVFYLVLSTLLLFLVGTMVDSIPSRKKRQ